MPPDVVKSLIIGLVLVGIPLTLVLGGPIGRALAARIAGRGRETDVATLAEALRQTGEQVAAQLEEMSALRDRLGELEERVDFAERMLAQRQPASRLPKGSH